MNLVKRLYRLRPLTAVLLCLLGALPCLWYLWKGHAAFSHYRRSTGEESKRPYVTATLETGGRTQELMLVYESVKNNTISQYHPNQ